MYRNFSLDASTDSDFFYVEHSTAESSPVRNNTPPILNSTQLSGTMAGEAITIAPSSQKDTLMLRENSNFKANN